jgi:hypothetical protein
MRQIQLTEADYEEAQTRASDAGFCSVDDYISSLITFGNFVLDENTNLDHLFTPERLAHIYRVLADVKNGGQVFTVEESREDLANYRAEWIRKNGK